MAPGRPRPVCSPWALPVVAACLAAGCSGIGPPATPAVPATTIPEAGTPAELESGEFTIAASMNDTWNTVGQVLVRTDGVAYESRAQMLGIYALRYRGERFLIRTEAVVMSSPADGMVTRVLSLGLDGKRNYSPAAIELLKVLEQRVPLEIDKYRQPIQLQDKPKRRRTKGRR